MRVCRQPNATLRLRPSVSLQFTTPRTPAPISIGRPGRLSEANMALKRMVLQIGMGTDIRGADYTKAAGSVVEGGREIPDDAGTNTTVIANAAAVVRLDIG